MGLDAVRRRALTHEVVEDGTVGALVAVASVDEVLQRVADRLKLGELTVDLFQVFERQRLHVGARPVPVAVQRQ